VYQEFFKVTSVIVTEQQIRNQQFFYMKYIGKYFSTDRPFTVDARVAVRFHGK
jgi:hypothetical protein